MVVRIVSSIKRITSLGYVLRPLLRPLFPAPRGETVVPEHSAGASRHNAAGADSAEWFWSSHRKRGHDARRVVTRTLSTRHDDTRIGAVSGAATPQGVAVWRAMSAEDVLIDDGLANVLSRIHCDDFGRKKPKNSLSDG